MSEVHLSSEKSVLDFQLSSEKSGQKLKANYITIPFDFI